MAMKNQCECGHLPEQHRENMNGCCFCKCDKYKPFVPHDKIRILAIDPSWVTGMAIMEANRMQHSPWIHSQGLKIVAQTETTRINQIGVVDVSKNKTWSIQQKIAYIVEKMKEFVNEDVECYRRPINVFAIETPFAGAATRKDDAGTTVPDYSRSYRSSSGINHGRLFQAIVDLGVQLGIYDNDYSEIHNSQAKTAVIRGTGVKKQIIYDVVTATYALDFEPKTTEPHKQAITDAISIGLGYIKLSHKEIRIPTAVFIGGKPVILR